MISTISDIVGSIVKFFSSVSNMIGLDVLFILSLAIEVLIVVFFLVKSAFSYEATLNRALDKINFWLFERKVVTEENIKDLNMLFKTKAPKRLCYYWQQYILFREGSPSSYLSTENLIEKPLKTSSYNSNIKNLTLFSGLWALLSTLLIVISQSLEANVLTGAAFSMGLFGGIVVALIGIVFVVYLRARKNSILNSLYQNVGLFGRFMDNACIDLPSYIDYQILFTPQEIEQGQPVLREFLDYKARKEKEEFNKAKEEAVEIETYDFSSTGVDGSIVLDRAMKESELYLKKKERILLQVSQLESELESRRKNFDNVQKDYQTKLQASKENIQRLRQMQEETTNRIESNYYRKQQTQEVVKQEQFEQEFEQLRAKYLLEKAEGEEEIAKLNSELEKNKVDVEKAMLGEYQTFFDKFCHSAEKVVAKVFSDKFQELKTENERDKHYISELEIKLKNLPQGVYDGSAEKEVSDQSEGQYDENGNYVYPNGTYYDSLGNFHDENGNVYSQDGTLISETKPKEEKKIVDFDDFDSFDFMTDSSQKEEVYGVAENIINDVDKDNEIEIVNNVTTEAKQTEESPVSVKEEPAVVDFDDDFDLTAEPVIEDKTAEPVSEAKKRPGRPKKTEVKVEPVTEKRRGRPKKVVTETKNAEPKNKVGRPKKTVQPTTSPKRSVGRPKKIVKPAVDEEVKRGRGRPKKQIESIEEINRKLSEEEARVSKMRNSLNHELEQAMNEMNTNKVDSNQNRRAAIMKEIEDLQREAQSVIGKEESENRISEINAKLERLLAEINKLND